jgi:hypothetical protein
MADVGIFYGQLVLVKSIWYVLWPFGKFYSYFVYIYRFGMLYPEKSGNPAPVQTIFFGHFFRYGHVISGSSGSHLR